MWSSRVSPRERIHMDLIRERKCFVVQKMVLDTLHKCPLLVRIWLFANSCFAEVEEVRAPEPSTELSTPWIQHFWPSLRSLITESFCIKSKPSTVWLFVSSVDFLLLDSPIDCSPPTKPRLCLNLIITTSRGKIVLSIDMFTHIGKILTDIGTVFSLEGCYNTQFLPSSRSVRLTG